MRSRKLPSRKTKRKEMRKARAKSKSRSRQSLKLFAVGTVILVAAFALYGSATYTTGVVDRTGTATLSDDPTAVLGIDPPTDVESGGTAPLVSVNNNFPGTMDITVTLTGTTATNGDIVVGGVNRGDSYTVSVASGNGQLFNIDTPNNAFQDSPATFDVSAVGGGVTASASREVPIVNNGGGGGGIGGAANLNFVTGSGIANVNGQSSGVRFQLDNTGTNQVTITDISVDVNGGGAKQIVDGGGGTGAGQREVFIDAASNSAATEDASDGYLDVGTYTLGSTNQLTQNAVVQSGDTATIYAFEVQKNNGQGVNVSGRTVTVTITASDGSTNTYTFTAT